MEESFSRSLEYFLSILKISQISSHSSFAMGSRLPVGDSNTEKPAPVNKFIPVFNFSKNIFGRDSGMNGVRINRDGDNISINLHIIVYYGYNIPQLSYEIQSAIKNVIEEFTGLKVDAVNISVEGIDQEND
ncbi:Asp23/Gls24 family envelope stress response protein [Mogibacterium diversum]|uniref:Asp23/Gls24 family envelope stress response protein n=1 Tax=Mogibacterium diversum TaxID=114527 RepID=UPI0028D24D87|nr:Asp23/Gls24 family envelope stress response protein [Mogibacterium diversum]